MTMTQLVNLSVAMGSIMFPFWDDHFILTGFWSILYLFVAYFSLLYYINRNQSEQSIIRRFFGGLSTIVRWGINFAIWFLTDTHPLNGQSKFGKSWPNFLLVKFVFSIGAILPTIIYSRFLLASNDTAEAISAGAGLVVAVYLFIRAWFFGHKLKDMQAAASDDEADTN